MSRTVTYEVNDVATVVDFVRYGQAVAVLPASIVDGVPDVVTVPLAPPVLPFEVTIAVAAGRRLSAATTALLAMITRERR